MIRLIGVLTGAALAIGLLLLILGTPELVREPLADTPNRPVAIDTTSQVPAQPEAPRETVQEPQPVADREAAPEPEPAPETEPAPEPEPASEPEPVAQAEPLPEATAPADPRIQPGVADTGLEDEATTENWYAFWSPFRSRIAADGFVSELSRTTGLDYRVVKLKPGVFEVAVAYTDDSDIEDKLMRISAATGLDMSGG